MTTRLLQFFDAEVMGKIALGLFFLIFVAVVIYAWTRPRSEVDDWSRIPLGDDDARDRNVNVRE